MSFFDDALNKTREAFDIVSKKTEEVVSVQKLRLDVSLLENKRDKDFKELGKLCYEKLRESEELTAQMRGIIADITDKNEKLNDLSLQIARVKNRRLCPACGAVLGENAVFCQSCGEKVTFDTDSEN